MKIKKKIFYSNTFMVFAALLLMLAIGGILISIFKDEFLTRFSEGSQLSEYTIEVDNILKDPSKYGVDWNAWNDKLLKYNFRYYAELEGGGKEYSNLRHSEWEVAEEIKNADIQLNEINIYFMEGTTALVTKYKVGSDTYLLIAASSPEGLSFWGMDRGIFEMFLIMFLITGMLAIIGILLCSQLFTRMLIKHILKPVKLLSEATKRMGEGNLNEPIAYEYDDEFKLVCDSFDVMQQNLKDNIEQKIAYEKARTEMVSGISHDLRTPLTSIKGYIKGMMDGVANTEEKKNQYLKIAYRKSCDMDALLSKLLFFSKLETGNMPFFKQKIDIVKYVLRYIEEKTQEFGEENIICILKNDLNGIYYCNIDIEQMNRVQEHLI